MAVPSITENQVLEALGQLLTTILPPGVSVIIGQTSRVSSPLNDYVVMWPLSRPRLATDIEEPDDTKFIASIAGTVMTVSELLGGLIEDGNTIFGIGVVQGTIVVEQTSGPVGGAGNYTISQTQNVSSTTMSTGTTILTQSTEFVVQLDVHGPNSGDNAQVISTVIRSSYAVSQMAASGVTPLYSDDPRQAPFITAAQQWDERYTIDVHLQFKPSITTPQEFFDAVDLNLVDVDVVFPD